MNFTLTKMVWATLGLVAFCGLCGDVMATEEPKFELESKSESFEIRRYPAIVVAEARVEASFDEAGNKAFRILADYIFGNNKTKAKIEMTAPVTQEPASQRIEMTAPVSQVKTDTGFRVQFTMPEGITLENAPTPNDTRVILRQLPARAVAVHTYTGSWSLDHYQEQLQEFRSGLQKGGVKTKGEPIFARYNSPFRLWFLRRNEIWLEVDR